MSQIISKQITKNFNIAVVGATGNVGRCMLGILSEHGYLIENVFAVASERSQGLEVSYGEIGVLKVQDLENFDFSNIKYALFSPGSEVSAIYAPKAARTGCIVIDNTSYFRMDEDVPLIVPEINPHHLNQASKKRIIANPNCAIIQIAMALKPLHDISLIKRVTVATYQSVSGAGKDAMEELYQQTKGSFSIVTKAPLRRFERPIAFNLIPKIGEFLNNGYTDEEWKLREELKKILDPKIELSATCVRVPVFIGHSAVVHVEFTNPISVPKAQKALRSFNGVEVMDDIDENHYTTPIECVGEDFVYVGRIRQDASHPNGLSFWVVSDNLRKGAALNAVQILQLLEK